LARWLMGVLRQPSKAAAAAPTAASATAQAEAWKRPRFSRVSAGLMLSNVRPLRLRTH
jgi:hypothetical protein